MIDIAENIRRVRERIRNAAERSGRSEDDVTLIAVTKTHPSEIIRDAVAAGITDIGENRAQEAEKKFDEVGEIATWHFIGHLQTNKVKNVLRFSHVIHSVDRISLAKEINKRAERPVDIFVEVNIGEEESKAGIAADDTINLLRQIRSLPNLHCRGLMAIPPWLEDPEKVRPYFRAVAGLQREINNAGIFDEPLRELSMGMTDDFETAIEEGATIVRVGRAIFGPRRPRN